MIYRMFRFSLNGTALIKRELYCISKLKYRSTIRSLIYFVFLFFFKKIRNRKSEQNCSWLKSITDTGSWMSYKHREHLFRKACSAFLFEMSSADCDLTYSLYLLMYYSSTSSPLNKLVNCYVFTFVIWYFFMQRSFVIWNGLFSQTFIYSFKNSPQYIRLKID